MREVTSSTDEFFSFADINDFDSCLRALDLLDAYIKAEGLFDGVIAFSQGAIIAASYLCRWRTLQQGTNGKELSAAQPFKCASFFSAPAAYSWNSLRDGRLRALSRDEDGELIQIPTAHIWGRDDDTIDATSVSGLCATDTAETFMHEGGHEIPGVRMNTAVKSSVRAMRRVIAMAG
ncbi:hypothetical protein FJTKL_09467 [Diaporthe vaccinii]